MTRTCGECTLCCKLLPVREVDKGANEKCRHQSRKGCAVYGRLSHVSPSCALWNCRWLVNDDTRELSRPDRSGYVLDMTPDFITTVDNETGAVLDIEVVQVWVDPKRPDAHKDPGLRAYLERRAWEGIVALIRYSDHEAFVLVAPPLNGGEWSELAGTSADRTHTAQEVIDMLEAKGKVQFTGRMTA